MTRLTLLILLLFPCNALAYLDPVTGSVIFQVIIGIVMGAVFTLKLWWRRFISLFRKKSSEDPPADQ